MQNSNVPDHLGNSFQENMKTPSMEPQKIPLKNEAPPPIDTSKIPKYPNFNWTPPKNASLTIPKTGVEIPAWMHGITASGSAAYGYLIETGAGVLSWTTLGVGVAVLAAFEGVLHLVRKREKHKLERRARNTERAQAQINVVIDDVNDASNKVELAADALHAYQIEINPELKEQKYQIAQTKIGEAESTKQMDPGGFSQGT